MLYNFLKSFDKKIRHSLRRPLSLLGGDLLAILLPFIIFTFARSLAYPYELEISLRLAPILCVGVVLFYIDGLYNQLKQSFPQELRKLWVGLTVAYLVLGVFIFLQRGEELPSRFLIVFSWFTSMWLLPIFRSLIRHRYGKRKWWSKPTILIGSTNATQTIAEYLLEKPQNGLRPNAIYLVDSDKIENSDFVAYDGVTYLRTYEEFANFAKENRNLYAIVAANELSNEEAKGLMEKAIRAFSAVLLVLNQFGEGIPFSFQAAEIARTTGLEIKQNLFDPKRIVLKRFYDLSLSIVGGICILPILIGLGVWIFIESPGNVFFRHKRIGYKGKPFYVLKFRTMVVNAEKILDKYLADNPELQEEWEKDHKLKNDPRVTKVGEFLRRTSLDELPQIWNVIKGEMSLVGPRPIVDAEIPKYGDHIYDYIRVRPGMTGLWQVSGRNNTSYEYRVHLDNFYTANWSLCMDIWILARTPQIVFKGSGAY